MKVKKQLSVLSILLAVVVFAGHWQALLAMNWNAATQPIYSDQRDAVKQATYWLVQAHQNDDGGYSSFSTGANKAPSALSGTLDAMLAISAAGFSPAAVFPTEQKAPLDYLTAQSAALEAYAEADGAQAGKVVLALTAAAIDPRDFGGYDYVARLTSHLTPAGTYGVNDPFKQSLAMLGVAAAGEAVPASAVAWLEGKQAAGGSWDDGFGTLDSVDTTAMAVMALAAAGRSAGDASIDKAVAFLDTAQEADAGWAYAPSLPTNANSTAMAIQALSAVGEDWYAASGSWAKGAQTPMKALLAFQNAGGAFQADFGSGLAADFFATVQSIPGATGNPYPLPARYEAARQALVCLDTLQDPTTGGWPAFAGGAVDASGTSRAIQAIAAAGEDPEAARWTANGVTAVEALEELTPAYLASGRGGRVGIVMQGVTAAGAPHDVTDFAGEDLPALAASFLTPDGEYDSTEFGIFAHAKAMLGLLGAGEPVAPKSIDVLLGAAENGDWGSPDSNGIGLQVLAGLGQSARQGTIEALQTAQTADGGWGFGSVSPSSTAEVVQGLTKVGLNPFGPLWSEVVEGRIVSPANAVMAQQTENGCWPNQFGPGDDPYSTTDAVLLLTQDPGWGFTQAHLPVLVP